MQSTRFSSILCFFVASIAWATENAAPTADDAALARQINRLVGALGDDRAAEREAAEQRLLDLAGTTSAESDRFLALLPEAADHMPLAVRERLVGIRREVEERTAKAAVTGSEVTLRASNTPLAEVLAAVEEQTGNRFKDQRGQPGNGPAVTVDFQDEPYWSAVDQILDEAGLGVYNYAGEDALAIVHRGSDDAARVGRADYRGPFRLEVLAVQAQRNLRQPQRKSLRLQLEVAWEPRLRPIAISQPAAELSAFDETGSTLAVAQPAAVLDVEVPLGTQAAEIVLPFELPSREIARIATLVGTLKALVPGRTVEFRFDDLPNAAGRTERRGGVEVTVDAVRLNNMIWEIHMRFRLDEDNRALESHRGWVFQNLSYLVDDDGERIDNIGLETTRHTPNEVGLAYLFDLPDGIDGYTWVYETPAAIFELPVEYELRDIELP